MQGEYNELLHTYMTELLNGTMELILFFDRNGTIIHWNDAAQKELRYQNNSLKGIKMTDIFPKLTDVFAEKEEDFGNEYTVSTVAYRKNQTCFPVNLKITYMQKKGSYLGMCSALSMAAEQEALKDASKAKEEVAQVNTFRNDFVANVTHELRTPINGILGHARNLMETQLDNNQHRTVEIIENCCDNMIKIINNLLDFSKLQAGRFTIEQKEFDFQDLMEQVVNIHIHAINDKGLRLVINMAKDIPKRLIGDEVCIKQILNNLLSNAIKFTSVGQIAIQITKTMQKDHDIELFFMVIDTGIGIDPAKKDMLFQSFYQADASITRRFGGTGLGLSICKELVELMGGTITIDSVQGKGSNFSFTIRLKLTDEDAGKNELDTDSAVEFPFSLANANETAVFDAQQPDLADIDMEALFRFGTKENLEEIHSIMEKMLICIDMGTWEKAENFAGVVKRLVDGGDSSLKRLAFRLEMTVRKEDHEKAVEQFHKLEMALKETETASQS